VDREDPFEIFGAFDPSNKVVGVYALYYQNRKIRTPYPKNVIQFTEPQAIDYWGVVNATVESVVDKDYVIAGTGSICADITTSGGKIFYPKNRNLNV
jgi:hypothetical protein